MTYKTVEAAQAARNERRRILDILEYERDAQGQIANADLTYSEIVGAGLDDRAFGAHRNRRIRAQHQVILLNRMIRKIEKGMS